MANIADNLKRLLGTEGYNIQEVLENADSIGGGSSDIPIIEFIKTDDNTWSIDKTTGIDDPEWYAGPCIIKTTNTYGDARLFIGNAYNGTYGAIVFTSSVATVSYAYHIFIVSGDTVTYNTYSHNIA